MMYKNNANVDMYIHTIGMKIRESQGLGAAPECGKGRGICRAGRARTQLGMGEVGTQPTQKNKKTQM
jgi:hypothetical protein